MSEPKKKLNIWARRLLTVVTVLPALLFMTMGLRWLVDPVGAAIPPGLATESGLGLSSQIGDLAAFFLVAGLSILIAVVTRRRTWFYPPIMLLTRGYRIFRLPYARRVGVSPKELDQRVSKILSTWLTAMASAPVEAPVE